MKQGSKEVEQNLHLISNALHNAYETLENIELTMGSDPEFCIKAIKATKSERDIAFESISKLKKRLREIGVYE